MRRVVLLAAGSRGDTVPQVALARALRDQGAQVLVLGIAEYADVAAAVDVPFVPIASAARAWDHTPGWVMDRAQERTVATSVAIWRWLARDAESIATAVEAQVHPGDLLIGGIMAIDLVTALVRARDCVGVHVTFAATLPTAYGPSFCLAPLPDRVSPINASFSRQHAWPGSVRFSLAPGQALRGRLGLPRHGIFAAARDAAALPTLIATTPVLAPPAPDWPLQTYLTGPWLMPQDDTWAPPAALTRFLDAGPAPVYVGFGSMLASDPAADLRLIAEAAQRAGVRVVMRRNEHRRAAGAKALDLPVLPGLPGLPGVPGGVFLIDHAPHHWLFPRMAAVVHHGGAGTTIAGLRAGVPTGIIAHTMDQPHQGRRIEAVGVGPAYLPRRRLTVEAMAQLFTALTTGPDAARYRLRATQIGARVRAEDGIGTAISMLTERGWL